MWAPNLCPFSEGDDYTLLFRDESVVVGDISEEACALRPGEDVKLFLLEIFYENPPPATR